jgi:hypothetical protein
MGLHRGVHAFLESYGVILRANPSIWIIALVGLLAPLWDVRARKHWGFTVLLFLFSFLSLCPGAYFRPHYFILLLPAIALLTGIAVGSATATLVEYGRSRALAFIPILVFIFALGLSIFQQRKFYFFLDPAAAMKATYGTNPFLAAMKAAEYVRQNSPEDARIAVLGSEPEIYFYARRRSATGYLYMYSLIVRQKYTARMQQELIHEVEMNRPEYLIYADVAESWGAERDRAPQASAFLAWVRQYAQANYDIAGVTEVGDSARDREAIYVLKRKQQ